ncbi:flagellar rod assembly protein/muramidase FlgJ [Gammaproteobacteria bacterium 53_120_T64]|nr:flagellar rod assembly protein/muramidase FlgJ [Gammaproteobacteria bacterium 53_120_T64]
MTTQAFVNSQASAQQVYHSFSGFEQMRAQARDGDSEALSGAAKQFESVFVQMMLKAMRDTVPEGGLFESEQMDFYEGMFDQQLSLNIANGKGIGLAEVIERQLGGGKPTEKPGARVDAVLGTGPETALKMPRRSPFTAPGLAALHQQQAAQRMRDASAQLDRAPAPTQWQPTSPEAFADALRPHARRAAATLGVSENLLIAQAALETGWGQKVMPRNEGGSSFNLFGIKANAAWQGDKASTATLEYRDGIAQRERAEFRAYTSIEQSFDDYVAFLREQPRYSAALQASDDKAFVRGLQSAGYATDPAYAQKILALKDRLDGASALELAAGLSARDDRS